MSLLKGARLGDIPVRYLSIKKAYNYLKYINDLRSRKIITSSFPPDITFQASAYCNTNCRLCPVGLGVDGPPKGFLTFKTFKKVIDEMKDVLIKITFADWGEPFLNPNIYEMIRYAEKNKIMTHASTNLHAFKTKDDLKNLIESGLSFLTISLHGISQETYQYYQPGKDFKQTVEKIRLLETIKRESKNNRKPVLFTTFAITRKNEKELAEMPNFADSLGARSTIYTASLNLRFHPLSSWKSMVNQWAQKTNSKIGTEKMAGKKDITTIYDSIRQLDKIDFNTLDDLRLSHSYECDDPWRIFVVKWDGVISLCCIDFWKFEMGNVNDKSIKEIWNNVNYQVTRKFLKNQQSEMSMTLPCKRCVHC